MLFEVHSQDSETASVAQKVKFAQVFRSLDIDHDGWLGAPEFDSALKNVGFNLSKRDLKKFMDEVDKDGDCKISFDEFCDFAMAIQKRIAEQNAKSKNLRIPRQYLTPDMYQTYSDLFVEVAGDDGLIDVDELHEFFTSKGINLSRSRLETIMSEVDGDGNGNLDESEFMTLLIRAMNLKKRKVGPGLCSAELLHQEGWTILELRRAGYDCEAIVGLGLDAARVMQAGFTVREMRDAGVSLQDLVGAGWDASDAREIGFNLEELVEAKCSVRKIRVAGFNDVGSAEKLRQLGFDVKQMKNAGWQLSQLKLAGFSSIDLRLAGYSTASLVALQQQLAKHHGPPKGW